MTDPKPERPDELPAGDFSTWLAALGSAIRGDEDSNVPCGSCTACCTSSQFIHIAPDERAAIARIPKSLVFPAPQRPRGHLVMGYDERGHCPMLVDDRCTIYADRPRTCRTYDCRVFTAAEIAPGNEGRVRIEAQVRRWRFDFGTVDDGTRQIAIRTAAVYLDGHRSAFPDGAVPRNATPLAVLAVTVHTLFLGHDEATDRLVVIEPDLAAVQAALVANNSA